MQMQGADRGVRRGRDARKRPRGAEPNRPMHAQRGKILPRGGAAAEELRREGRERREGEARGREARATICWAVDEDKGREGVQICCNWIKK
ncbi:hypothetical protein CISIN_1g0359742mg, partial [Citrus sinensis]